MSTVRLPRAVLPLALLAALLPLLPTPAATAAPPNLVRNGSFEQPPLVGELAYLRDLPEWEVSEGSEVEVQRRVDGPPADGEQHVELDAKHDASPVAITQRVPTEAGVRYLLTFAFGPRPGTVDGENVVDVSWGGTALDRVDAGASDPETVRWRYHRYVVTAAGDSTPVTFAYAGPRNSRGGYLDDVRVERVPDGVRSGLHGAVPTSEDGWAAADGGTYGGALGDMETLTDPDTLEEDLREVLSDPAPRRVKIALPDVDGAPPVVVLDEAISVTSYKTVFSRRPVVFTTKREKAKADPESDVPPECRKKQDAVFDLIGVEQVVIWGLTFDGRQSKKCWPADSEGSDAIHVVASRHLWFHHNTFRRWADGAIDIKSGSTGSDYVTASWNRFEEVYQAHLWQVEHASFHHNHCVLVGRRCPKSVTEDASKRSFVHAYDNVIERWHTAEIVFAKDPGAVALVESNAFVASSDVPDAWKRTRSTVAGGEESGGCLVMVDNVFSGGAVGATGTPGCLPPALDVATRIWNAPEPMTSALVDTVRQRAGRPLEPEAS